MITSTDTVSKIRANAAARMFKTIDCRVVVDFDRNPAELKILNNYSYF